MKAVMVMFDSLNRHMLPPYGCEWIKAPNFSRLANKTVTFETSYVCSMPCMPARRDLHTGRPNFLHRSWGPIEPFDDSVPEILKKNGIHSHLATDHYHYFEDGGANYHCRYKTWESFRGQEGDPWMGQVAEPDLSKYGGRNAFKDPHNRQEVINRQFLKTEADQSQPKTFDAGIDFIRRNRNDDKWFVQIETFDPHEPYFTQQQYKDLYPHGYTGPIMDWPEYKRTDGAPQSTIDHLRYEYAALLSMCDRHLGKVLDVFDELNLWEDTMLIVWTDHGFLLGEHDWWAKVRMPFYEEVAHTPFFVWDPRSRKSGERRTALVQPSIDLGPTLLDFFGLAPTADMTGKVLSPVIERDEAVREAGIFGVHGSQVNVTDGRHVYMRAPDHEKPLFDYTLMPGQMQSRWNVERFNGVSLAPPFSFTKNAPLLKAPVGSHGIRFWLDSDTSKHLLWDVKSDPTQQRPMSDAGVEERMIGLMKRELKTADAPAEMFTRLGVN